MCCALLDEWKELTKNSKTTEMVLEVVKNPEQKYNHGIDESNEDKLG